MPGLPPPPPPPPGSRAVPPAQSRRITIAGSPGALVFIIAASVGTLCATVSQWYSVNSTLVTTRAATYGLIHGSFALTAPGYGGWRTVIPIWATLTFAVALIGFWLRFHGTWSTSYAWTVRLCLLVSFGLCVGSLIAHNPTIANGSGSTRLLAQLSSAGLGFGLGFWAWFGTTAAFASLVASLTI